MQVRCVRPRDGLEVGDVVEVPDGAAVSPLYFGPAEDEDVDKDVDKTGAEIENGQVNGDVSADTPAANPAPVLALPGAEGSNL